MSGRRELPGWPGGSGDALVEVLSPPPAQAVCHVLLGKDGRAQGVVLQDGTEVRSKLVLSNASPQITFLELTPQVQGAQGWQGLGVVASPGWAVPLTAGLCPGLSHPRRSCQRILSSGSSRSTRALLSPRSMVGTSGATSTAVPAGGTLVPCPARGFPHPTSRTQWLWIGCPVSWLLPTPATAGPCPTTSAPSISTARAPTSCTRPSLRPPMGTPPAGRNRHQHTSAPQGRGRTAMAGGARRRGLGCSGPSLPAQLVSCSPRPMIELCIPSALDPGLAPQGCHVVSLFTQYTPSVLAGGQPWDEQARNAYADTGM